MIRNIQALRALAAIMVMFVHLEAFLKPFDVSSSAFFFGNAGVDIFFVLSGFIIVHSTLRKAPGAGAFLVSRMIRVVPLYWILTLAVFTIALTAPHLLGATMSQPLNLFRSLLFIPYLKSNGLVQPILFVGWSLNYEMFFYAVFAIGLLLTRRDVIKAAVAASLAILGQCIWVWISAPQALVLRFFGEPVVIEFVIGMGIALAAHRWPRHTSRFAWPLLASALLWIFSCDLAAPRGPRWLVYGIPGAVVLWSALMLERRGLQCTNSAALSLGDASYALYLVHPFALQGTAKAIEKLHGPIEDPIIALAGAGLAICLALLLSIALHRTVERPLTRLLKAHLIASQHDSGSRQGPDDAMHTPVLDRPRSSDS